MNRLAKVTVLTAASFVTIAVPLTSAFARGYHDGWGGPPPPRYYDYDRRHHHRGNGNAVAAGVVGLAAGALIGSALSQPSQPQVIYQAPPPPPAYYPPAPAYYPPAPAAYRPVYQPWTPAWHQYCSSKYRSFNPQTGTYRGYDGLNHFCNAN